jgi:O-succinylbenzoate synthase
VPATPAIAATLPALDELAAGAVGFAIPMRVPFRDTTVREGLLLHGPAGWGEFAPFPEYRPPESARWLASALEAAWSGWPPPVRTTVPVNAIVPAVPPDVAAELVMAAGCTTVKVKVAQRGQRLADDVARVRAVRDALGPDGAIRVDANGAWSVDEASTAIAALEPYHLQYVEQPCATLGELTQLRRRVGVPVAVDEGLRRAPDPVSVARLQAAADLVVLKVPPLGGVASALALAARYDRPAVVSSALDTSVGLAAGLALAAALPELPYACGLGTAALLAADVTADRVHPVGGVLLVRPVEPDPDHLAAVAMDPMQMAAWLDRLAASYDHLAVEGGTP